MFFNVVSIKQTASKAALCGIGMPFTLAQTIPGPYGLRTFWATPSAEHIQRNKRKPTKPWLSVPSNKKRKANAYLLDKGSIKTVPQITEEELAARPEGIGAEFYTSFFRFKHAIRRKVDPPDNLIKILDLWTKPAESDYFLSLILDNVKLRSPELLSAEIHNTIMRRFVQLDAPHRILRIITEPKVFGIIPTPDVLHATMPLFLARARKADPKCSFLEKGHEQEAEQLVILDQMYRLFAAMVFWNVAPSAEEYSALVIAGILSRTMEGVNRSKITAAETKTLGLTLSEEAEKLLASAV